MSDRKRLSLEDLRAGGELIHVLEVRQGELYVPDLDRTLLLRGLTRAEQVKTQDLSVEKGKIDRAKLDTWTIIYGSVEPHFTQHDLEILKKLPPGVVAAIVEKISELSGFRVPEASPPEPDVEAAEAAFREVS